MFALRSLWVRVLRSYPCDDLPIFPAKLIQGEHLDQILGEVECLLSDSDRFKQRAAAEFLAGISRGHFLAAGSHKFLTTLTGSKHWPKGPARKVWAWTAKWLDVKYKELKPDTLGIWEACVSVRPFPCLILLSA
jgi:proteasome activator subunit 4